VKLPLPAEVDFGGQATNLRTDNEMRRVRLIYVIGMRCETSKFIVI
jgi:hypothetical protein